MTSATPQPRSAIAPAPHGSRTVLEVNDLGKVFQWNASSKSVLEGITFEVTRGELVCILGPSGCGKTTLLKILAGFIAPTSGEVLVDGERITHPGPDRCVVFQEDTLFPWLTVEENIAFGLKAQGRGRPVIADEVDRYLALVGLTEFRGYLPREISGGMKQRVALARVLILKPNILLMDEPFGALDSQTREEMQGLLLQLWKELLITIVFVTHDVNEALLLADRILVMESRPGAVRADMPVMVSRPRRREGSDFIALSQMLRAFLRS